MCEDICIADLEPYTKLFIVVIASAQSTGYEKTS